MVGFYHGTTIPGNDANEGIYFINKGTTYSIYIKRNGKLPERFADANEVTSETIENLWGRIGQTFVQKTFTIAGIDLQDNITLEELVEVLELKKLAYKDQATGTLEDYVKEVTGVDYTPTGRVEVNLGYARTDIVLTGSYTPKGTISAEYTPQGNIQLSKGGEGGIAVSGTISKPVASVSMVEQTINQIGDIGTLPSYTPAQYTAPSVNESSLPFAVQGVVPAIDPNNSTTLIFEPAATAYAITATGFNPGAYTAAQFNPGTLPTIDNSLSVVSKINNVDISVPEFTGDKINATFIGTTSDIEAEFKGEAETIQVSGTYDKAIVDSATFTGNGTTITPTLVKESKEITVQ